MGLSIYPCWPPKYEVHLPHPSIVKENVTATPLMCAPIRGDLSTHQLSIQCSFVFDITAAHSPMAQLLGDLCCCTAKYLSNRFFRKCLVEVSYLTYQYQFTTEHMNILEGHLAWILLVGHLAWISLVGHSAWISGK